MGIDSEMRSRLLRVPIRLRNLLLIGIVARGLMSPFLAHPYDVYGWYQDGSIFFSQGASVSQMLVPYGYSIFLFAIPAYAALQLISSFAPTFVIPVSQLNPVLLPGPQYPILLVPGILFDILVKTPLIASDTVIAILVYKMVLKSLRNERLAVSAAAIWFLNPLVFWVSSGWGMFDTIPTLFTVLSLYFLEGERPIASGASLAIATALKYYAIVLFLPAGILILGKRGSKAVASFGLSALVGLFVLFIPYAEAATGRIASLVAGISVCDCQGIHSSGLSFWSTVTLFFPLNQNQLYLLILVPAMALTLRPLFRQREIEGISNSSLFYSAPLLTLLAFYKFVGENYLVWAMPFLAILAVTHQNVRKPVLALGFVGALSSVTSSLLPYYFLPASPWIGSYLVSALAFLMPYQVSPGGTLVSGLTVGKAYLAGIDVVASGLILFTLAALLIGEKPERANQAIPPPSVTSHSDLKGARLPLRRHFASEA